MQACTVCMRRDVAGGLQAKAMEEGDIQVQAALDGLVQLDAVDMLREALLTALEPQVCDLLSS